MGTLIEINGRVFEINNRENRVYIGKGFTKLVPSEEGPTDPTDPTDPTVPTPHHAGQSLIFGYDGDMMSLEENDCLNKDMSIGYIFEIDNPNVVAVHNENDGSWSWGDEFFKLIKNSTYVIHFLKDGDFECPYFGYKGEYNQGISHGIEKMRFTYTGTTQLITDIECLKDDPTIYSISDGEIECEHHYGEIPAWHPERFELRNGIDYTITFKAEGKFTCSGFILSFS